MYKAELVFYAKRTEPGAYKVGEFQQLSVVGSSDISKEAALEDAYKQAWQGYQMSADDIKSQKVWTTRILNKKGKGFRWEESFNGHYTWHGRKEEENV